MPSRWYKPDISLALGDVKLHASLALGCFALAGSEVCKGFIEREVADEGTQEASMLAGPYPCPRCHPQNSQPDHRKKRFRLKKAIHRERDHVERFINKLKQFRRIATRYDKLGATFFAFVRLASVRIWLRSIESMSWIKGSITESAKFRQLADE